jgi:hypothetical protein
MKVMQLQANRPNNTARSLDTLTNLLMAGVGAKAQKSETEAKAKATQDKVDYDLSSKALSDYAEGKLKIPDELLIDDKGNKIPEQQFISQHDKDAHKFLIRNEKYFNDKKGGGSATQWNQVASKGYYQYAVSRLLDSKDEDIRAKANLLSEGMKIGEINKVLDSSGVPEEVANSIKSAQAFAGYMALGEEKEAKKTITGTERTEEEQVPQFIKEQDKKKANYVQKLPNTGTVSPKGIDYTKIEQENPQILQRVKSGSKDLANELTTKYGKDKAREIWEHYRFAK